MHERTSVGLDVHARSVVACAIDGQTGELRQARLTPDNKEIHRWLAGLEGPVAVVYEAGPTGFGLARYLTSVGIECVVAAPSKLARPSGDRVKTDTRDALHLARLLRLGEVTAVTVPGVELEAARDLVRARDDVRGDLSRARQRVSKLLLRQGIVYSGGTPWTMIHEAWLRQQRFDQPGLQLAFDAGLEAMLLTADRRDRLDKQIEAMAAQQEYAPMVARLGCLRGISTLTGFALTVEIGDWTRFTGSTIGAFIGLVPTEHSSGASRSQGSITKTGNSHVRRLLIEAAWQHQRDYRTPSRTMRARWAKAPAAAATRGHQGNQRLHARWVAFNARHKRSVVANTAIARELAGWCWSLATLE